jgi:hypothetical protein
MPAVAPLLLATLLTGLTGCSATFPTIDDLTSSTGWVGTIDSSKLFAAQTTNAANFRVMMQFSRHTWIPSAHEIVVPPPTSGNPDVYVHRVPDPETFFNNQRLFYRWLVLGRGPTDLDTVYAQTPDKELQIGCAPGRMTSDLRDDQAAALAFLGPLTTLTGPGSMAELAAKGYGIPTHAVSSLAGMGMAMTRLPGLAGVATGTGPLGMPTLGTPTLLLFAPAAGSSPTDGVPDFPYTFVGYAYTADFNPTVRPTVACLPWDAWFIHEAGWHDPDGSFFPTPPSTDSPRGSGLINTPPFRTTFPSISFGSSAVLPTWHPRFWDMHLWVNTSTGIPGLAITHPTLPIPGWPTGPGFFAPALAP